MLWLKLCVLVGYTTCEDFLTFLTAINEDASQADSTHLLGETAVVLEKHKIRISKK